MALAAVAVAVVVVVRQHAELTSVADLDRGDCVDGAPFLEGEQPALADLTRADCDDPHDAEVLVLRRPRRDQAAAYRPVVPDAGLPRRPRRPGRRRGRATSGCWSPASPTRTKPAAGDTLACFGFAADGTRLEGRVRPR